jgi:2-haloacid dehalogenase
VPDVRAVRAVYVDLYGTLLDLAPLDAACEAVAPGHGRALAQAWRAEQLRLTWLRTITGRWADFEAVTAGALRAAAARLGVDGAAVAALDGAFDRLPARREARPVLRTVRERGARLGVLSNGSEAMLQRALTATGLADLFDDVLSVDAVRRYKPDPAVYALAVAASGVQPSDIGFVTANDWDAAGAAAFGFRVAWLRPDPALGLPALDVPEVAIASWADLAAALGIADPA